jgi:hypothetical protein
MKARVLFTSITLTMLATSCGSRPMGAHGAGSGSGGFSGGTGSESGGGGVRPQEPAAKDATAAVDTAAPTCTDRYLHVQRNRCLDGKCYSTPTNSERARTSSR